MPHHGSVGALEPELYAAARPKLALVSCGYGNQWHFPAAAVRNALAQLAIPLESTAERGRIRVSWQGEQAMRVDFARQDH